MSNDYRIPKERLPVVLTTIGGERIVGELFVQPSVRNRDGREEAPDLLNASEPFFPMRDERGETFLVAKDRVREMEVGPEQHASEVWRIGSPATIEVLLAGGDVRTGVIYLESLAGRSRVIDFLNRVAERFLTLHTANGELLINRSAVERVRSVD